MQNSPGSRMRDVADRAGVSLSTVSRALRGAPGVDPEVRRRVERCARELSYVVSRNASGLVTGRTGRIAALVPFLQPWFFGVALAGVSDALRDADLDLLVYQVGDVGQLDACLRRLPLSRNADAVIAVALDLKTTERARLDELGVPLVFCNQRVDEYPSVYIDNEAASVAATRHVLNLGHTDVAFIGSRDATGFAWTSDERWRGHAEAMAAAGLPRRLVIGGPGHRGGASGMAELLSSDTVPTAVLAESDDIAMGVLTTLQRSRVAVPDAISVVGFDNNDVAEVLDLTTVAQPVYDLGFQAGQLAGSALEGDVPRDYHVVLPTQLVLRRSTSTPRPDPGPDPTSTRRTSWRRDVTSPWWRDAVIYQVYPRSFADADGDGVGDIAGVTERLDHLAALGVDGLWLSPFYPSGWADGGYDVADFRDVDPLLGTLADFDALVRAAHDRGLKILIDVVPNHSSVLHRWFQDALAAAPGSPARDRYVFRDGRGTNGELPPTNWVSTFGGPAWTRVADGQWYLHLFAREQPDFNWDNPEVRAEFRDILRFWADRGVDGFRIDVAYALNKDLADPLRDVTVVEGGNRLDDLNANPDHPYLDRPNVHEVYRSGVRSSTSTTSPAWPSPRRGCPAIGASATPGPTNSTRPSTSTSSPAPGTLTPTDR
ncbi:substrate-binding domain-containing protein [Spiractinospora alimapuensis]|nr:substrate-binding domain-containing protein [Spiractinospora alimapuensis]